MNKTAKEHMLDDLAGTDTDYLIKLRGDAAIVQGVNGIGPGRIAKTEYPSVYKISQPIMLNQQQLSMSFLFHAEDLLWVSQAPQAAPEAEATHTPGVVIGSA